MHRRITAAFFLFIFVFNSVGYYFIFKIEQQQVKEQVKTKLKKSIPQNELIILAFNPSSEEFGKIEWIEDREFRYKGLMYDIVRQSTDEKGMIYYHCVNDEQEEKLFANLDEHIKNHIAASKNNDNDEKDSAGKIIKDYFLQHTNSLFLRVSTDLAYLSLLFLPGKLPGSIPTPPPDKI